MISAILIAGFFVQDIAWAYPFEDYKNLAITGLKNSQTLQNLKTAMSKKLRAESLDMAKPRGSAHLDTYQDSDIVNAFIRQHIVEGRAVEVDEKEEKVMTIRRDCTNTRAADIGIRFRNNDIFNKIRQAKDPALLKKILQERINFRNLSPKEKEKLIQIIHDIRLSFILGQVIICLRPYEGDLVLAHAGTGRSRRRLNLKPTVWIGEILFNRLTVQQCAQFLLEEAHHILKPAKKVRDRVINVHGKIDEAENPKEVIEHDKAFIDAIDPTIDELIASGVVLEGQINVGEPESPNMARQRAQIRGRGVQVLPSNAVYRKILALNRKEIVDKGNEHLILDIKDTENPFYPIYINIRRKESLTSIGAIELDIKYMPIDGKYILELGLVFISAKKYQRRGIFPQVLSLISDVMPPNSKLAMASLMEAETLKALAGGTDWLNTRMGKILYGCGWKPETILISEHATYLTAALLDRNNDYSEFYDPDSFMTILKRTIKDIDTTNEIGDAAIYVGLTKTAKEKPAEGKPSHIDDPLLAIHTVVQGSISANPFPDGSKVLFSSDLFEEMDRINIEKLLKSRNIEMSDSKEIKRRATNNKMARDKMIVVLTKEEFESIWKNPDERLWIRSSIFLLNDRLTGHNYLYLEGVIGLAKAVMQCDRRSIALLYSMLSEMKLDEAVLDLLEDNAVTFAIKAILKFKPIEADTKQLENYKTIVETFLVNA